MGIFDDFGKAFLSLAFPPRCLHCEVDLAADDEMFCRDCLVFLERIDVSMRCPYCCSADFSPQHKQKICHDCLQRDSMLQGVAAVFDYMGPAATLVKKLKYGHQPYLAKGAAGYLVLQFLEMSWPKIDVIVPVPLPWSHWMRRGYNQSALLAAEMGAVLKCPVAYALRRKSGDFSQAGLSREQRESLTGETIQLKKGKKTNIEDQVVLLVDDVLTTGTTLRRCAEELYGGFPKAVYGLTLCRAI